MGCEGRNEGRRERQGEKSRKNKLESDWEVIFAPDFRHRCWLALLHTSSTIRLCRRRCRFVCFGLLFALILTARIQGMDEKGKKADSSFMTGLNLNYCRATPLLWHSPGLEHLGRVINLRTGAWEQSVAKMEFDCTKKRFDFTWNGKEI